MLFIWLASLGAMWLWLTSGQTDRLTLAAGPLTSETFALGSAIASEISDSDAKMAIEVFETGGSRENIRLLLTNQVDLGTIQADTSIPDGIQAVAVLYHDAFHLLVREGAGIEHFSDLRGHRVAIPPVSSAQNGSFWFLAEHYGLRAEDMNAQAVSEEAADFGMLLGGVDAVFRVRAPGNPGIRDLIATGSIKIIPIRQADALTLKQPALDGSYIPKGSYRGFPSLPAENLETAGVDRLLVTRANEDPALMYRFTRELFESRSDIVGASLLGGFIGPLGEDSESILPAHPGARRYYDREKPGILQQNARLASAGLYAIVILMSALVALRSHWMRTRRIRMGDFNSRLMDIAERSRNEHDRENLLASKLLLMDILGEVVGDLDRDRVSQEEFEHFSFTWQAVDALVRDRLLLFVSGAPVNPPAVQGE